MCTETFLRLPAEKRERILDAAWEEFTTVPFAGASINQIVRRAGIPRGSFYQYFADKSDLFSCLMEGVRDQIREMIGQYLREAHGDVFQATLTAYDRLLDQWGRETDPLLDRCTKVLRINPGIDLEAMLTGGPKDVILQEHMELIDLDRLRRRDLAFVRGVCCLSWMCLAASCMAPLMDPGRHQEQRAGLVEALDILRRGSLSEEALRSEDAWMEAVGTDPGAPTERTPVPDDGALRSEDTWMEAVGTDPGAPTERTPVPDDGALRRGGAA